MQDAKRLSVVLLILSIVTSFFIAFNGQSSNVKISMIAYAVMAAILIVLITASRGLNFSLVGESFTPDIIKGLLVGGAFILLNQINSAFALGAPAALLSLEEGFQLAALVIVAPIVEEFFFRGLLYPLFYDMFKNHVAAAVTQGALFAVFHFFVYGGFLGLQYNPGLFVGAFVFGTAMAWFVERGPGIKKVTSLETTIVAHAVLNAYLFNLKYHIITFV